MLQRAGEKIGHCGERNMRVRPDVDPVSRRKLGGTQMIEENERPHHLPSLGWQYAPHDEAAEVTLARTDHL